MLAIVSLSPIVPNPDIRTQHHRLTLITAPFRGISEVCKASMAMIKDKIGLSRGCHSTIAHGYCEKLNFSSSSSRKRVRLPTKYKGE